MFQCIEHKYQLSILIYFVLLLLLLLLLLLFVIVDFVNVVDVVLTSLNLFLFVLMFCDTEQAFLLIARVLFILNRR